MATPPSPSPPSSAAASRRRHGKAQMHLLKILRIISLFPAVDDDDDDVLSCSKEEHLGHKRLFDVDLNIDLGEIEPLEHPAVVTVTGGGGDCVFFTTNDRREISTDLLCFEEKQEETVTELSEISHVGDQSSGIDFNGGELGEEKVVRDEEEGGGGYLDLLIEAAQLILGEKTESPERGGGRKRKKHCRPPTTTAEVTAEERWYVEFEDTSPVVKSKRGRNQVLPLKYRDSVVEPLVRRRTPSWRRRRSVLSPARRRAKW